MQVFINVTTGSVLIPIHATEVFVGLIRVVLQDTRLIVQEECVNVLRVVLLVILGTVVIV